MGSRQILLRRRRTDGNAGEAGLRSNVRRDRGGWAGRACRMESTSEIDDAPEIDTGIGFGDRCCGPCPGSDAGRSGRDGEIPCRAGLWRVRGLRPSRSLWRMPRRRAGRRLQGRQALPSGLPSGPLWPEVLAELNGAHLVPRTIRGSAPLPCACAWEGEAAIGTVLHDPARRTSPENRNAFRNHGIGSLAAVPEPRAARADRAVPGC
jgi:hypothetical protein